MVMDLESSPGSIKVQCKLVLVLNTITGNQNITTNSSAIESKSPDFLLTCHRTRAKLLNLGASVSSSVKEREKC